MIKFGDEEMCVPLFAAVARYVREISCFVIAFLAFHLAIGSYTYACTLPAHIDY